MDKKLGIDILERYKQILNDLESTIDAYNTSSAEMLEIFKRSNNKEDLKDFFSYNSSAISHIESLKQSLDTYLSFMSTRLHSTRSEAKMHMWNLFKTSSIQELYKAG